MERKVDLFKLFSQLSSFLIELTTQNVCLNFFSMRQMNLNTLIIIFINIAKF